jgi:hypothetical protein
MGRVGCDREKRCRTLRAKALGMLTLNHQVTITLPSMMAYPQPSPPIYTGVMVSKGSDLTGQEKNEGAKGIGSNQHKKKVRLHDDTTPPTLAVNCGRRGGDETQAG